MKKIKLSFLLLCFATAAFAQNWKYLGSPYINGTTSTSTYLYFGDMEVDASGNTVIGYWEYQGKLSFAKFNGSTWSQLPSPGTFPVSFVDIETHGSDYYISYMGARGSNYYAFVKKYTGSSWSFIGDSVLIGGIGQGGSFDFLLDNNGVPTLIGLPKTVFGNKTVKQFSGGIWSETCEIPNSTSVIFKDGSAVYNNNNKLNCVSGGVKTLSVAPYIVYYTLALQIDGNSSNIVGDTIFLQAGNSKYKVDSTGNQYLLFNNGGAGNFHAYKLNGTKWNFIADTAGKIGYMTNADITNDGKVVFSIFKNNLQKCMYYYDGGKRFTMDSINISGFAIASMNDLLINKGEVNILAMEIKATVISDFSVLKHAVNASSTNNIDKISSANSALSIFPNPSSGKFKLINMGADGNSIINIYDVNGRSVYNKSFERQHEYEIEILYSPGIYLIELTNDKGEKVRGKIIIE